MAAHPPAQQSCYLPGHEYIAPPAPKSGFFNFFGDSIDYSKFDESGADLKKIITEAISTGTGGNIERFAVLQSLKQIAQLPLDRMRGPDVRPHFRNVLMLLNDHRTQLPEGGAGVGLMNVLAGFTNKTITRDSYAEELSTYIDQAITPVERRDNPRLNTVAEAPRFSIRSLFG